MFCVVCFQREIGTLFVPDQSGLSSRVRVGRFVLFAHWTALLRVKWDRKQSAVDPVRECAWAKGERAEPSVSSAVTERERRAD